MHMLNIIIRSLQGGGLCTYKGRKEHNQVGLQSLQRLKSIAKEPFWTQPSGLYRDHIQERSYNYRGVRFHCDLVAHQTSHVLLSSYSGLLLIQQPLGPGKVD